MRTIICWLVFTFLFAAVLTGSKTWAQESPTMSVGVAKVDVTPQGPVVLAGYGSRTTEHEGIDTKLWCRAMVIGGEKPVAVVVLDNCGVPGAVKARLAQRLTVHGILPERLIVAATHTHNAPNLIGYASILWAGRTTPEQDQHVAEYTAFAIDKMEAAVVTALKQRTPMQLEWAQGRVTFGGNRRVLRDGKWAGFGFQRDGPVDHSLPVLAARDREGKVRMLWANYACHCTTVGSRNRVGGDWAGFANQWMEREYPEAVSLMSIGCGADVGPQPSGNLDLAAQHGRAVAMEVRRLLSGKTAKLTSPPTVVNKRIKLPLAPPKPRTYWEEQLRAGSFHQQLAKSMLGKLDASGTIPSVVDYPVSAWKFGDDLAMVFLAGEVVVDYSVRLNQELDWSRLWISAWANDMPGYIPSRRVLAEGGYEPDFSQVYYEQPGRYDAKVEDVLVNAVRELVGEKFAARPGQEPAPFHRIPADISAVGAEFVVDGVAENVQVVGSAWKTVSGELVCSGTGNILQAGRQFGPGDFKVHARLGIDNLDLSAASVVINDSHFGFAGKQGEMFTEGPVFGRKDLGVPVVRAGEVFDFIVQRKDDQLLVQIDGKEIIRSEIQPEQEVQVGLRPWRSTMRVTSFRATGNLIAPPKPLPHTNVYVRGQGGYHTYRIPAIVTTRKGTLLAFCEGRKSGGGDAGNIDMLVSRSTDYGQTWSRPMVIWNDGGNTCGNPAPVVDQDTGVIWLPMTWNLGSDHESQIMSGKSKEARHVYVTHSKDDGLTWAKPKKISDQTRQPHWRWYATGPGNAIQLTRGEHKGRLLIPANHSDHSDPDKHPYRSHVFWSDDHGQTWQLGGVQEERTNESTVVELLDGSVLQCMRSYHGKNNRAMAISKNGGQTWGNVYLDDALNTPVCQANILRYSWPEEADKGSKSRILFSSPHGKGRTHLTVWLSYDEGKTWPVRRLIHSGGSAYSNLIVLPQGRIGVLYEKDGYGKISLATFTLDWLEEN